VQKYRQLKETLRSNFAQKQANPIQPDIEKKKETRFGKNIEKNLRSTAQI